MDNFAHCLEMKVRDYELDMQGIVNNSVYQNYLEHARHQYIKTLGIDFAAFAEQGIDLVVIRVELDYKFPLRSDDDFFVRSRLERESKLRFCFLQDIYRKSDEKLILKGKITCTSIDKRGRPCFPAELEKLFIP